jgi:enoyl-CoA hydratase/carnithine racemase
MSSGPYRDILFDVIEPGIAQITLNRPDKLNAYTGRMCKDVVHAVDDYVERDELRCLIVTGAGRGFCSGGDISGGDPDSPDYKNKQLGYGHEMRVGMHEVVTKLHRIDKPVVAMINGAADGGRFDAGHGLRFSHRLLRCEDRRHFGQVCLVAGRRRRLVLPAFHGT